MKLQELMKDDICQILLAIIIGIVICYFIFGSSSCGNRNGFNVGGVGSCINTGVSDEDSVQNCATLKQSACESIYARGCAWVSDTAEPPASDPPASDPTPVQLRDHRNRNIFYNMKRSILQYLNKNTGGDIISYVVPSGDDNLIGSTEWYTSRITRMTPNMAQGNKTLYEQVKDLQYDISTVSESRYGNGLSVPEKFQRLQYIANDIGLFFSVLINNTNDNSFDCSDTTNNHAGIQQVEIANLNDHWVANTPDATALKQIRFYLGDIFRTFALMSNQEKHRFYCQQTIMQGLDGLKHDPLLKMRTLSMLNEANICQEQSGWEDCIPDSTCKYRIRHANQRRSSAEDIIQVKSFLRDRQNRSSAKGTTLESFYDKVKPDSTDVTLNNEYEIMVKDVPYTADPSAGGGYRSVGRGNIFESPKYIHVKFNSGLNTKITINEDDPEHILKSKGDKSNYFEFNIPSDQHVAPDTADGSSIPAYLVNMFGMSSRSDGTVYSETINNIEFNEWSESRTSTTGGGPNENPRSRNFAGNQEAYFRNLMNLQYQIAKILLGTDYYYDQNFNIYYGDPNSAGADWYREGGEGGRPAWQVSDSVSGLIANPSSDPGARPLGNLNLKCKNSANDYLLLVFKYPLGEFSKPTVIAGVRGTEPHAYLQGCDTIEEYNTINEDGSIIDMADKNGRIIYEKIEDGVPVNKTCQLRPEHYNMKIAQNNGVMTPTRASCTGTIGIDEGYLGADCRSVMDGVYNIQLNKAMDPSDAVNVAENWCEITGTRLNCSYTEASASAVPATTPATTPATGCNTNVDQLDPLFQTAQSYCNEQNRQPPGSREMACNHFYPREMQCVWTPPPSPPGTKYCDDPAVGLSPNSPSACHDFSQQPRPNLERIPCSGDRCIADECCLPRRDEPEPEPVLPDCHRSGRTTLVGADASAWEDDAPRTCQNVKTSGANPFRTLDRDSKCADNCKGCYQIVNGVGHPCRNKRPGERGQFCMPDNNNQCNTRTHSLGSRTPATGTAHTDL
jgi:hypothetical protein